MIPQTFAVSFLPVGGTNTTLGLFSQSCIFKQSSEILQEPVHRIRISRGGICVFLLVSIS